MKQKTPSSQHVQTEALSLIATVEGFGARLSELLAGMPQDDEYPPEMHHGEACPTLDYALHGLFKLIASEDLEDLLAHLRMAAELTGEQVRRTWEKERLKDLEADLRSAFHYLGRKPPEDLGQVDRGELAEHLRRRAMELVDRSDELSRIAGRVQPETSSGAGT